MQCDCKNMSYYYGVNQGGGSLICDLCPSGNVCIDNSYLWLFYNVSIKIRSSDGFGCIIDNSGCTTATSGIVPCIELIIYFSSVNY